MPGLITNILQQPIRWQLLAQAALARLPVDHRSDGVELSALNVAALGVSNIAIRSSALDAAIQAHGGNGLASEYGLMPYWGLARLLRIAPVNREMILNYVAQHSLGLPRSY